MVAAVVPMMEAPAPPLESAPGMAERLAQLRADMDDLANRHCQAQQGVGPAPDLSPLLLCVAEAEGMISQLAVADAMQAHFMIGCGWHMLGNDDKAFEPLMEVCRAPEGVMAVPHQLSAIMIALPMLRKRQLWAVIVRTCDRAKVLASGKWPHFTLPFTKGIALANLNRPAQAAELFEQAIELSPGFSPAYVEFDKAATALRDFERCRSMAQRLVDHGGHWVNRWQRPDHFLTDVPLASRPWHDAKDFPVARLLEENFSVIKGELEALEKEAFEWGKVGSNDRGNENSTHDSDLVASGDWSEIVLLGDTERCTENCKRCPETARLLRSLPQVAGCAALKLGETLFSRLRPGTSLRPHCGPTNMRLTCHLGLAVPEGCEITCGGETRTWEEGKCIVFDDSFEHEVHHRGSGSRMVLLVNFWHPDVPRASWEEFTARLRGGGAASAGPAAAAARPAEAEEPCPGLFAAVRAAGGHVSSKLARGCAPPLNVPGVVAQEDIEEGEELVKVPSALHLSPHALQELAPELWRAVSTSGQLPDARRPEALQAAFLCRLLQAAERRRGCGGMPGRAAGGAATAPAGVDAAIWEAWERWADVLLGEDFAFHPYRRATAEPDALRAALEPSPEADFFASMARDVLALHQAVAWACASAVAEDPLPLELFIRARLCMLTRSFKTCHNSTLVPVVDLFNHAHGPSRGVAWRWDEGSQAMVVVATRKIKAGEELLCAYGPRSNLLLYRTYGFTHPPDVEPSWSYIVRPQLASSVYEEYLPEQGAAGAQVVLDSNNLEASLCEALNAVTRGGREAAEFLAAICRSCKKPYEADEGLRPALEALRRARLQDPASAAWWSDLPEAARPLASEDGARVKMSEYLCLLAHEEALGCAAGRLEPDQCLRGTERLRESLGEALRILREEGRDIAVEQVAEAV